MARIRTIKPEFFTHPEVVPCSIPARLLFVSLLTQADDEGRLYDQPRKIGGLAFADTDRVKVDRLLQELYQHERLCSYTADGRACFHIPNFRLHQVISRPTPSRIPPCPLHDNSRRTHGVITEDSIPEVEQGTGNREVEEEHEELKASAPPQNGKGKNGKPFYLADVANLHLLMPLFHQHVGWERELTPAFLTACILGSPKMRIPAYGARAVNAAIEDLYANASSVSDPAAYLRERAEAHSQSDSEVRT